MSRGAVAIVIALVIALGAVAAVAISSASKGGDGTTAKADVKVDGGRAKQAAAETTESGSSEEGEAEEIKATVNGKLGVEESSVEKVEIEGDEATAQLSNGAEIPLRREGGEWVPQISGPEARQLELEGPRAEQPEAQQPEAQRPEVEAQQPQAQQPAQPEQPAAPQP